MPAIQKNTMRFLYAVVVSITLNGTALGSAVVTIASSNVDASAGNWDLGFYGNRKFHNGTEIPTSESLHSSQDGFPDFYSDVQIEYSKTSGQTILNYAFDQRRPSGTGYNNNTSWASNQQLFFTVDSDTAYKLTGKYDVSDVNEPGSAHLQCQLADNDNGEYLFTHYMSTSNILSPSFDLGIEGTSEGEWGPFGNLEGTLLAGHTYSLFFYVNTNAEPGPDSGASATGYVSLVIGEENVPEPTTMAIVITSLIIVCNRRYRQVQR